MPIVKVGVIGLQSMSQGPRHFCSRTEVKGPGAASQAGDSTSWSSILLV